MKIDKNNYLRARTVCKSCYKKNRRRNNNNNTLIQNQQSKSDNNNEADKKKRKVVDTVDGKKRTLSKTYLINHILHQKQEPISSFTKSLNQYPNIKAQASDEIQPLEKYENSTVVFDDMLLSKQKNNIDLFFTRGRHNNIDNYFISRSYFHLPKTLFEILLINLFYLNKL